MCKETLFLINPVSGGRSGIRLKEILDSLLAELSIRESCETAFTTADVQLKTSRALSDYHTVIVAGGDGTVARIVQKLAELEKKPRLGIIPCGTGNDLARVAGGFRLYKQKGMKALVEALLAGKTVPLDVFSVNEKLFFTNYCGIGLDAKISNDFNMKREAPFLRAAAACAGGRAAYAWYSAANLNYRMPFDLELIYTSAGNQHRRLQIDAGARQVLVTSIGSYAAGAMPSNKCLIDDGLFEVTVIKNLRQWLALHLTRFMRPSLRRTLLLARQRQASRLELHFTGSTCFQADGELYEGFPESGQHLVIEPAGQLELIFI